MLLGEAERYSDAPWCWTLSLQQLGKITQVQGAGNMIAPTPTRDGEVFSYLRPNPKP